MEDPRLFGEEMSRLVDALEATMQHPCFLGSGRDEDDQILHMVVSRFLQQKQNHVSVAKGGFSSLRAHINDNPSATVRLETNAGAVVAEAASHQAHDLTPGSKMGGKLSASLSSWGTALKEKTQKASKAAKVPASPSLIAYSQAFPRGPTLPDASSQLGILLHLTS